MNHWINYRLAEAVARGLHCGVIPKTNWPRFFTNRSYWFSGDVEDQIDITHIWGAD